jgi:hypothetical protein
MLAVCTAGTHRRHAAEPHEACSITCPASWARPCKARLLLDEAPALDSRLIPRNRGGISCHPPRCRSSPRPWHSRGGGAQMTFDDVLAQVFDLLQREGRVSYRALRRRFDRDADYLEDLKAEILQAKRLAIDEDGVVLVWGGAAPPVREAGVPPEAPGRGRQRPASCCPRSTAGSPRGLRPLTCGRRRHCWRSCDDLGACHCPRRALIFSPGETSWQHG